VISPGIRRVNTPSPVALTHITFATLPTPYSELFLELFNMLPARATRVIAIMRIDHTMGSLLSRPRRSRKRVGATRRKSADAPKTIEPALSVVLIDE
jgi:hypothetical protein